MSSHVWCNSAKIRRDFTFHKRGRISGIYVIEDNTKIPQHCIVSASQIVAERRKAMIDITKNGVDFAVLEGQLLSGEIDRPAFLERTMPLGVEVSEAAAVADKFLAIASNQAARRENLKPRYDYIVVGSGAAGSVVARRLAENPKNQVLLLEAGEMDLKPNVLTTENWYFNMGGPMDWSFAAEPDAAVNNRSLHQAMGKALGGGTSINGMVWARGHKNDFQQWARESGDTSWGYQHILEIYKRIEDWQGTPDAERRGTGGPVYVQAPSDPSPLAPAFLAAAESLGIPVFADQNGILQEGSGGGALTNIRIRGGRRLNIPATNCNPLWNHPNPPYLREAWVASSRSTPRRSQELSSPGAAKYARSRHL